MFQVKESRITDRPFVAYCPLKCQKMLLLLPGRWVTFTEATGKKTIRYKNIFK